MEVRLCEFFFFLPSYLESSVTDEEDKSAPNNVYTCLNGDHRTHEGEEKIADTLILISSIQRIIMRYDETSNARMHILLLFWVEEKELSYILLYGRNIQYRSLYIHIGIGIGIGAATHK